MSLFSITGSPGPRDSSLESQISTGSTALGRDWELTSTNRGGSTSTVQTTAETTTAIFQSAPYCGFSDERISDELKLMVLDNVDHHDLYQLRLTSRDLSRLSYDDGLWKSVAARMGFPIDPDSSLSSEKQVRDLISQLIPNIFDLDDLPEDILPILKKPVLAIDEINILQTVLTDPEFLIFYDYLAPRAKRHGADLTRPRLRFKTSQELFAEAKRCREEFQANLAAFVRENHLHRTSKKLISIPKEAAELIGLEHVDFSDNKLTSIPMVLSRLPLCNHLNLSFNRLTSFPSVLEGFVQLHELDLGGNSLVVLPQFICKLTRLTSLFLYDNRLTTLPKEIANLKNLSQLAITDNPIQWLPAEISFSPFGLESIPRLTEAEAIERGFLPKDPSPTVEEVFLSDEED